MSIHVVIRATETAQKNYLTQCQYVCKVCPWTGTVIESCAHIAQNQVEILPPVKNKIGGN